MLIKAAANNDTDKLSPLRSGIYYIQFYRNLKLMEGFNMLLQLRIKLLLAICSSSSIGYDGRGTTHGNTAPYCDLGPQKEKVHKMRSALISRNTKASSRMQSFFMNLWLIDQRSLCIDMQATNSWSGQMMPWCYTHLQSKCNLWTHEG